MALLVVTGCDDVFGLTFVPDAQPIDAAALTCYGRYGAGKTGLFQYCTATLGVYPQVDNLTIDTDTDSICASNAAAACVVTAPSIEITVSLRAVGSRPLVLVSASTLVVGGAIDVSSNGIASVGSTAIGAGADPLDCVLTTPTPTSAGGPGGSFQTMGGAGGQGEGMAMTPAAAVIAATNLRGGCPGNSGVMSVDGDSQGFGGAGGGALYLIAATSISIATAGSINASGSPGLGASAEPVTVAGGGGGGGGAGGLIGLDSPIIAIVGTVIANGGGGGGGGGGLDDGGSTGNSAMILMPTTPAAGGAGGAGDPTACNGGDGFAGGVAAGDSASGACVDGGGAGGGGGGGAGYVKVFGPAPQITGVVSPAPG